MTRGYNVFRSHCLGTGALVLVLVLVLPFWAGTALAQHPGSKTGRHRSPVIVEPAALKSNVLDRQHPWKLAFFVGNQWAGDLFRVEVINGASVPWVGMNRGGFLTSRFHTGFEDNFDFSGSISRNFGDVWRVRLDLSRSQQDISATALVGQGGGQFLYDRILVTALGLSVERDLVALPSAPYVGAGIVWINLDPTVNAELAQTGLGARLVLGYRQVVGQGKCLLIEGRLSGVPISQGDFVPAVQPPYDPEVSMNFQDHLIFFGIYVGVRMAL